MTLPASITSVVFPSNDASTFCGVALGDSFAGLALPAFWNDSHSDGKVRYGWLDVAEGGIAKVCCSVADTLGRVSRVDISFELDDEAAEKAVFADLCAAFSARLGSKGSKAKKSVEWPAPGDLAGVVDVRVASFTMDGERIYRVEAVLSLARGVEITVDSRSLFINVEALARVLASKAWPAARCLEVFQRFFARETVYRVDEPDLDAYREILKAAKAERPDGVPAMMDAICALMDWSDVDKRRDSIKVPYVLRDIGGWSLNLSAARDPRPGLWLRMNPADLACLVHVVDAPVKERGAWAAKIVRALEWGDEAAMDAVRARVASLGDKDRGYLVWDTTDEIEARAFDLMTSGLDDDQRALWPFRNPMYSSSALRACVGYFTTRAGAPRPAVKFNDKNEHSARDRAEYAAFMKASFPALFDAALMTLLEDNKFYTQSLRAICGEVADEETKADGKTTWRLGGVTVTHSGDARRGRWTFKKAEPPKAKKPAAAAKPKKAAKS